MFRHPMLVSLERARPQRKIIRGLLFALVLSAGGLTVMSAGVQASKTPLPYLLRWSFAGGGDTGLGQCTEHGELPADSVAVEVDGDEFVFRIDLPAGQRVPCLGSRLPDSHTIEIFGQAVDGQTTVFPNATTEWTVAAAFDGRPAVQLGQAHFDAVADGAYQLQWSGETPLAIPGLSIQLVPVPVGEHDGGEHDGDEHDGDEHDGNEHHGDESSSEDGNEHHGAEGSSEDGHGGQKK